MNELQISLTGTNLAGYQNHKPKIEDAMLHNATETLLDFAVPSLTEVEEIIGYKFRNPSLLERAFTHHTFNSCAVETYERLEFIGDAVLGLLVARELYWKYPDSNPGKLTELRANNVNTEKLSRVAVKHGLHKYLSHRKPLFDEQVQEFEKLVCEYPVCSHGLINAPKVLADIVESLVGAVFIDCGSSLDTVWQIFEELLKPMIDDKTDRHPKTELHELCQKYGWEYRAEPDLENEVMKVLLNNRLAGKATYNITKKKDVAQNQAAHMALLKIKPFLQQLEFHDGNGKQKGHEIVVSLCD